MFILIGGGARSGKSAFALARARRMGARRVFVATAERCDDEMTRRIDLHAKDRGSDFRTVEAPFDIAGAIDAIEADVVVVDCLTLWLANLLLRGESEDETLGRVGALAALLGAKPFHSIVVTNEVGMGIVPETALGRVFRDLAGRAHQALAKSADEVYFGAMGLMIRLRPAPVTCEEER